MRAVRALLKIFIIVALLFQTINVKGTAIHSCIAVPLCFSFSNIHSKSFAPHLLTASTQRVKRKATSSVPSPVRFRESQGRGLILRTWVNDAGPYTFVLDTGAGANLISRRVATEARVEVDARERTVRFGGLSGASTVAGRRAYIRAFALGTRDNLLPSQGFTVIADALPTDIDGVLDPTEVFSPLGYTIDFENETVSAFDPRISPLRLNDSSPDSAVVRWVAEQNGRRPFISLTNGRRALIDTGSGFGLAINAEAAKALGIIETEGKQWEGVSDLGGGKISSKRIRPATVHIGPLALRNVPTDYLSGTKTDAPILLGRDAIRPFQITFDPVNRLIRFRPS